MDRKKYRRDYYLKNKKQERQNGYLWRKNNKEKRKLSDKKYSDSIIGSYKNYKNGAKNRGLIFELSQREFSKYQNNKCAYCGDIINGIGLDRVDNSKGYLVNNIVACCIKCNRMKLAMNIGEFLEQIEKIHNNSLK